MGLNSIRLGCPGGVARADHFRGRFCHLFFNRVGVVRDELYDCVLQIHALRKKNDPAGPSTGNATGDESIRLEFI